MNHIDTIVLNVANRFGITPERLRFGSGRRVWDARHAVFWAASQRGFSSNEISKYFQLDSSTVTRGLYRMESLLSAIIGDGLG